MKVDCSFREDATACVSTVPAAADLDARWRLFRLGLRLAGGGGDTSPRFIARFSWSWALRCLFEKGFLAWHGRVVGGGDTIVTIAVIGTILNLTEKLGDRRDGKYGFSDGRSWLW
jgi:hypothetical protein